MITGSMSQPALAEHERGRMKIFAIGPLPCTLSPVAMTAP